MSEDWFDVAFINDDEAILHGRAAGDRVVRKALSADESARVDALNNRHHVQMQKLLRELAAL